MYLQSSYSFELGGEKKTKGAALQFVCIALPWESYRRLTLHCSDCTSARSRCLCFHVFATYLHSWPHYVICNTIVRSRTFARCIMMLEYSSPLFHEVRRNL
jgi:hypothetical protein